MGESRKPPKRASDTFFHSCYKLFYVRACDSIWQFRRCDTEESNWKMSVHCFFDVCAHSSRMIGVWLVWSFDRFIRVLKYVTTWSFVGIFLYNAFGISVEYAKNSVASGWIYVAQIIFYIISSIVVKKYEASWLHLTVIKLVRIWKS